MDITDILEVLASAIVWHSTGDVDAGAKLLAALHTQDYEFRLLAEYMLAEGGERSLGLVLDGLESGAISATEVSHLLSAMWPKALSSNNALSCGAVGNA